MKGAGDGRVVLKAACSRADPQGDGLCVRKCGRGGVSCVEGAGDGRLALRAACSTECRADPQGKGLRTSRCGRCEKCMGAHQHTPESFPLPLPPPPPQNLTLPSHVRHPRNGLLRPPKPRQPAFAPRTPAPLPPLPPPHANSQPFFTSAMSKKWSVAASQVRATSLCLCPFLHTPVSSPLPPRLTRPNPIIVTLSLHRRYPRAGLLRPLKPRQPAFVFALSCTTQYHTPFPLACHTHTHSHPFFGLRT